LGEGARLLEVVTLLRGALPDDDDFFAAVLDERAGLLDEAELNFAKRLDILAVFLWTNKTDTD
jgi:hypothetical protein